MTNIKAYYHKGNSIHVTETTDADYARQCFDGSDREWLEVCEEAATGNEAFYIVSSGLAGCYMADNVSVYGCKADALRAAKDEFERWQEEDAEEEGETSNA